MSNYTNPVYYFDDGAVSDSAVVSPNVTENTWVRTSDWNNITGSLAMPFDNSVSIGYVDNAITHNWRSDELYEFLFEAILQEERDADKREMYKLALTLNNNDYRATVLEIETEKNESQAKSN